LGTCFVRDVEFKGIIWAFQKGQSIFGDVSGLSGFIEVLGDHFQKGRLAGDFA
jgi:hypothetical protein